MATTHHTRGQRLAALVLLGVSTASSGAELARINIRISANLVANTCAVSNGSRDMTVNLGEWAAQQFRQLPASPPVRFVIGLENCGPGAREVQITFKGITSQQDTTLLALNSASTATNLGIAILDQDQRRLTPGQPGPRRALNASATGEAAMVFYGQYVATGTVTPGSANSEATFELSYP